MDGMGGPPAMPEDGRRPLHPETMRLIIAVLVVLVERWLNWQCWLWDAILLSGQGVAGLLLLFMFFFSEHPAVDSNWQIWVLNPIALVVLPMVIKAAYKRKKTYNSYDKA